MTYRHHLFIDSLGQALIIIFFSYIISNSSVPYTMMQLMAIILFGWQFFNGLLSYKFFERFSKRIFVRITAFSLVIIFLFRGFLWVLSKIPQINEIVNSLTVQSEPYLLVVLPYFCAGMAIWYLFITFKDLYNLFFNTI